MTGRITLTLAHSPDPDDVFMWWPITGMIDPPKDPQRIEPARVTSKPVLDTGRLHLRPIAADIAVLNRHALGAGVLDVTALSMFAWALAADRYALTCFGGSFGEGYGPRVVGRGQVRGAAPRDANAELSAPDVLIAVPGVKTSAYLLLTMFLDGRSVRAVEMPFDRILDAVASGVGGVTHGLLIHQSQLTFADMGLRLLIDLGEWWGGETGLPLPLGGNAVRRDIDQRFGPGVTRELVNLMDSSIRYALNERNRSIEYAMRFAPELDRAQAERYIDMYVSGLTVDCGTRGEAAIQELIRRGAASGLLPHAPLLDLLRPHGEA